jgi:CBS domain-containing protein
MKVREIMSSTVETIAPDAMITEAAEKMRLRDVGVLPVEKEGDIVGIITDRDIVVRVIADELDPKRTLVSKAMTFDAVCCSEDIDVEEAARIMEEKQIHRLVVLGDDNTISGILSIGDIAIKMKDEHLLHEVLEKICEPSHVY